VGRQRQATFFYSPDVKIGDQLGENVGTVWHLHEFFALQASGIFANRFARAWCDDCGHDYFVAVSFTAPSVFPSCNTQRMVETTAHLSDHVFPRLPVRQWVLSVPAPLRYFMQKTPFDENKECAHNTCK
jgi:hypothetical protein